MVRRWRVEFGDIEHRFVRLGEALRGELKRLGVRSKGRRRLAQELWTENVPLEVSRATRVLALKAGILAVEVDSAAMLSELVTYEKEAIRKRIAMAQGGGAVKDIRFYLKGKR